MPFHILKLIIMRHFQKFILKSKTHVTIMAEKNKTFLLFDNYNFYHNSIHQNNQGYVYVFQKITSDFSVQSKKDITRPNSEKRVQRKEL